ncbi:hypothetical protein CKO15_08585 [Halorhodospira abdelmalekii]|uniref:DUF4139 domain-containing protein n=1 Tax=Halorhodospira abdelmalekii TaxID=421629 RepID=UPI0019067190|nr:DUF4139 domain-containing protein [Halorhodospira abdelmalekii]MBK1735337.1 hypothetical protein [Halorhodospira abdelmalekii]
MFRRRSAISTLVLLVFGSGAAPLWACADLPDPWPFPTVEQAEIYRDGARIVATGAAAEPLILPRGVAHNTVELRASGDFSRSPYLERIELDSAARPPQEGALARLAPELAAAINRCLDTIGDEIERLKHEIEVGQEAERAQTRAIERIDAVQPEDLVARTDWQALAAQLLETSQRLRKERLEMRQQRQALETELAQAQRSLRERQQALRSTLHGAAIVNPGDAGETITVIAQRGDIRWEPRYRADLERDEAGWALTWQLRAAIDHRGDDPLPDVDTTLSGRQASGPGVGLLPPLRPWILRPLFEAPADARRRVSESRVLSAMEMDAASAPPEAVIAERVDAYWPLGRIDVPAGRASEVELATPKMTGELRVVGLPQQPQRALFVGELRNTGETAWPAGLISLRREQVQVGEERLRRPVAPGETVELALGEADQVELRRRVVRDQEVDASGFFRQSRARERVIELKVRNGYDIPVTVQVLEPLPVADDDRVRVRLRGDAPTQTDARGVRGLGAWEKELAPGEEVTWQVAYTVEWDTREVERVEGLDGPGVLRQ